MQIPRKNPGDLSLYTVAKKEKENFCTLQKNLFAPVLLFIGKK